MIKKIFWAYLVLASFLMACNTSPTPSATHQTATINAQDTAVTRFFGIPIDSFVFEKHQIKRNENISDILSRNGMSYSQIFKLVQQSKDVFDVKKFRCGNAYYLVKTKDSISSLTNMVYQKNRVDYVVFSLRDSLGAWNAKKPLIRVMDTVSGVVNSSLWMSLYHQHANTELANELAEIYGWTIDFFGIQKGDHYKVLYEQLVVDQDTFGIGNIYAANFNHMNEDYQAYYFVQDSVGEFFDEEGNSLRKTFLKAPLRYKRISSKFTNRRYHPVLKIYRPHHGVDYAAAAGTPVHTIGDGVVIKKGYQKRGGGNYIKIKHNSTYSTTYMHLQGFAKGMRVGKHVKQGELIGYVGSTGLATGPHLDFRVYKNGTAINPLSIKSTPAKPVDSANIERFRALVDSLKVILN